MVPRIDVFVEVPARKHGSTKTVLAGRAFFSGIGRRVSTTFTYDASFAARAESFALQPDMPLSKATYHFSGLPGFMLDSAPDRWGRHLVVKRERGLALQEGRAPRGLDDVDFLLGAEDSTRQGAVRYRLPEEETFLGESTDVPKLVELPELLSACRAVSADRETKEQVKLLLDAGSGSLGGARPKASVIDGERLTLAKFPHSDDGWDVMRWEKVALELAASSGIAVPESRIERIGSSAVLLVRRFDRGDDGARVPYLSAMSVLASKDGQEADYVELADAVSTFCGDPASQLEELYRRIALSIAIHNTDDHLRNHGFLYRSGNWSLSPVFDVNPNPSENEGRATAVFSATGPEECKALREAAPYFGLSAKEARNQVLEVLSGIRLWQSVAKRTGCSESEIRMFAPVVANRTAALKDAFGL